MKTKILVSILIGFFLGVIAGWQGMKRFPHRMDLEARHKYLLKKFSSKLDLTKDQQEKVKGIFDEKWKKIEAIRTEMKPKFEGVRQETRKEISVFLTPDQQKKFDILDAEMAARREQYNRP